VSAEKGGEPGGTSDGQTARDGRDAEKDTQEGGASASHDKTDRTVGLDVVVTPAGQAGSDASQAGSDAPRPEVEEKPGLDDYALRHMEDTRFTRVVPEDPTAIPIQFDDED
jgi:hypothetical protein